MALPSAPNSISMNQVNVELGFPGTNTISLNDSLVRTLFEKTTPGSMISMNDGRGKSYATYTNTVNFTAAGESIWTVPSGVTSIWVKMWGAGGTAGSTGNGGGGGYMEGFLAVNPGNTIRLWVANNRGGDYDNACECDPNGDPIRWPNNTGFGGEASFVSSSFGNYMIVGGGGGGSIAAGGAGGGESAEAGANDGSNNGGGGGTFGFGGSGADNGAYHATIGTYLPGTGGSSRTSVVCTDCDNGSSCGAGGGGGGDGWGGGGLGYTAANGCDYPRGGGGGGGSSNYSGGSWSSVINYGASGRTPPETGNENYAGSTGYGGAAGFGSGVGGRVVIRY